MIAIEGDGTAKGISGRLEISTKEGVQSVIDFLEEARDKWDENND